MSADNGVYIAEFKDGFRVAELSAVENLYYVLEENDEELRETWRVCWGNAKLFPTVEEARAYAFELAEDCWFLEYGISQLSFSVDWRDEPEKE